jgi:hypothetical protein
MQKRDHVHQFSYILILAGLCTILYYNINISSSMFGMSQVVIYGIAVFLVVVGLIMGIVNSITH